jgi:hypothetical protein
VRVCLTQLKKARRDANDLAIINANAERLNEEAEDVLGYQEGAGRACLPPTKGAQASGMPRPGGSS